MTLVTLTKSKKSSSKDHGSVSCQIFTEMVTQSTLWDTPMGESRLKVRMMTTNAKEEEDVLTQDLSPTSYPTALIWETVPLRTYYSGFKFSKIEFKGLRVMLFSGIPISDVGDLWPMLQRTQRDAARNH